MANIDELSIVIKSDTEQAEKSIDSLIGSLKDLNTSLNLGNLNKFTSQLKEISTASAGLKDLGKNLEKVAKSSERIKGLSGLKSVDEEIKETDRVSTRLANTLAGKFNFDFAKDGAANTAELRSAIRQVVDDLRNGKQVTDEMSASMGELIAKFSHAKLPMPISGKDQMKLGLLPQGYFDGIGKDIVGKIQTELDKLEPKDVLGNLVPNLEKLAGVTLPDFSGIGVLADGMSKLSRVNPDKIAAIVNALHGIGSANLGNVSGLAEQAQKVAEAVNSTKASDGALKTMADNAQQASQAVALLTDKMHGFSGYAHSMETAAEMFDRIARSISIEMFERMNAAFSGMGANSALPKLESDIIDVEAKITTLDNSLDKVAHDFKALEVSGMDAIAEDAKAAQSEISRLYEELRNLRSAKNDFAKGNGDQSAEYYDNLVQSIAEVERQIKEYNAALKKAQEDAASTDITPQFDTSKMEMNLGELKTMQAGIEKFADSFVKTKEYNLDPVADSLDKTARSAEVAAEKMSGFEQSLRTILDSGFSQTGVSSELAKTLDLITALKQDIHTMESNTGVLDYNELVRCNKELNTAEQKLAKIREDITRQSRVGSPLTEEAKEAQKLQDRMYELQRLMSDMNSRKLAVDPEQYSAWRKELEKVRDRYNEIMGIKDKVEKPSKNIDILASFVALGHELQSIAQTLDHFGDLGIKGLKFAFKPLDNAIKEYKEKIESIGDAFKSMSDKARRHIDKISAFWKRAMKTFTFMLVRKAITAIITEMSDAIKSLAVWSKQFGTIFNDSISQITSNFSYIARSIVGAFEPIINFVVPAFNALADAIANVMAKLGEFFAAMTGQGYYMAAKKQVVDYAEEVEKARKAQKNLIAGLDDLNVITTPTATSSGMDDVAEQWKKVDVSDKMKEIADEVKKFAKRLFDPIKKAWDNAGQHVLDGWKYMTGEIKKLLKDIGRDLLTVWEQPETQAILENLLHTIGYIEEGIGNLAKKFREAWNTNDVGLHILENIRDIIGIITRHVEDMAKKFRDWANTLDFYPLLEAFENFTKKIQPFVNFLMEVLGDIWEDVILRHWKWQIEEGLPHVLETISEVISAFNWDKIRKDLKPLWTAFETMRENIDKGIVNAFGNLGKRIAEFANSEDFTNFTKNIAWLMDQITAERVEKLFTALGDAILNVAEALMKFVGSDDFKDFINKLLEWYDSKSAEEIADGLTKIAIAIGAFKFAGFLGKGLGEFFKFLSILQSLKGVGGIGGLLGGATGGSIATTLTSLAAAAGIIVGVVAAIYSLVESFGGVQGVLEELKKHFDNIKKAMSDAFERSGIADSINRLKDSFNGLLKALGNQKSLWQVVFTLIEGAVILLGNVLLPIIQGVIDAFSASMEFLGGILNFVGGIFDILKGLFTGDSDLIVEGARRMCEGIYFAFKGLFDLLAVPGSIIHKMVEGIAGFFSWLKEKLIGDPIVLDLVDGVVLAFAGMVKDVIEAIDGFVGDMVKLFTDLKDKAIEKIQELKEKVIAKFTELKNKAIERFNELKTKVVAKASEMKNDVVNKVHALKEEALQKFNELKERAVGTFNNLKNDATSVFNNLKSDIVGIAGQASNDVVGKFWEMVDGASQAFNGVLTAGWNIMSGLGSTLTSAVGDLWSTAKSWGKNILDGLNVGLNNSDGWRNVKRSVGLLGDAVMGFADKLRISSPSKVFEDYGKYIVEGLNNGIDENVDSTEKEIKKWYEDISKIAVPQFDFSQALPKDNLKMDSYQHFSGTASLDNTGIQESVRSGVMDAVGSLILPYLNDIAQSSRETANKELRIGDKQIGQSAQRYARDFQTRTGKPAYA